MFRNLIRLFLAVGLASFGVARGAEPFPVVTVVASSPNASEDGPTPGVFTVSRSGETTNQLTVFFSLTGTAVNGVDYVKLANHVTMAPGAGSTNITIMPIPDLDTLAGTNETVVLQLLLLVDPPIGGVGLYSLGTPSNAVVNIAEPAGGRTNLPPTVELVSPTDGSTFLAPASLKLAANARDTDGRVAQVEFFAGTNSLGVVTNRVAIDRGGQFVFAWTNVAAGSYSLTAKATDNQGASAVSKAVAITVESPTELPTVTVVATQPDASKVGPVAGVFTVSRTGDTTNRLTVSFSLGGTALNGVDYLRVGDQVTFAEGTAATNITITPTTDLGLRNATNATVVLQLRPLVDPPILGVVGRYALGIPSNAVVNIAEPIGARTNLPPTVELGSPANGAIFFAPATVRLTANAKDKDGKVTQVEFFAGTNSLGVVTNGASADGTAGAFAFAWTNVAAGSYSLTAKATDDQGATSVSSAVAITVESPAQFPSVTVTATQPNASEVGPVPGVFTVSRTGDTTNKLTVFFSLGGTAANGADYQRVANQVTLAPGAATTNITITPIADVDTRPETNETVVLQLLLLVDPPPLGGAGLYALGFPSNAVVNIAEPLQVITNGGPVVQLTHPVDGAAFISPATFALTASASEKGGTIKSVEFFSDSTSLGTAGTPVVKSSPPLYSLTLSNLQAGAYVFSARATDALGVIATSAPVTVSVVATSSLPVVTVTASSPDVAVGGTNQAFFTVTRVGSTNAELTVSYALAGSIFNRLGRPTLVNTVTIPAGATSAEIQAEPVLGLDLRPDLDLTLTAQLIAVADSAAGTNRLYLVGTPGEATITFTDGTTPPPPGVPVVTITARDPVASEPKNGQPGNAATFVVRRSDGTNSDLTVAYAIGGTATNGVDYAALSGSVTIPAGQHTGIITVTPLADQDTNSLGFETVILSLPAPSATNAVQYAVGEPAKASAIILDSPDLSGDSRKFGPGTFHLAIPGAAGSFWYRIDASADLTNWQILCTNVVTAGQVDFVDTDAAATGARFYRAVPLPGAPPTDD